MTHTIEMKASVINGRYQGDGLILLLRCAYGDARGFLPGVFEADGDLTTGSLTMIDSQEGRVVSHGSVHDGDDPLYDQIALPANPFLGFDPVEPMIPLDVTARGDYGIVFLNAVEQWRWTPRSAVRDPRVARVADRLCAGEDPARIVEDLCKQGRAALENWRRGLVALHELPPHVAMLARGLLPGDGVVSRRGLAA